MAHLPQRFRAAAASRVKACDEARKLAYRDSSEACRVSNAASASMRFLRTPAAAFNS